MNWAFYSSPVAEQGAVLIKRRERAQMSCAGTPRPPPSRTGHWVWDEGWGCRMRPPLRPHFQASPPVLPSVPCSSCFKPIEFAFWNYE